MRISDATNLLTSIFTYNLDQMKAGKGHDTYLVPFFMGDPGVGKTAIPKQVAKKLNVPYHQTIVAQFDAGELAGLPFLGETSVETLDEKGNAVKRTESRMIRLRPAYLPDPTHKDGIVGIYNLDELPQAFLANQNVMSQLVNEYKIGEHEVSAGITMCATGNKPQNKAGTTTMPTHLKDRLMFIEIEVNADDWLTYAAQNGIDPRIRSFIRNNPQHLHKFDVAASANPTPRSWEKSSAILSMNLEKHIRATALSGQIGGVATNFEAWLRVEDRMPKLDDVINNPTKAPVFGNEAADINYMLLAALADKANKGNIANIIEYIKRLPNKEFAAYWAQDCFRRDESLLAEKSVTQWKMTEATKLIF